MSKFARRKHFKKFRKVGVPFIDAAKLARTMEVYGYLSVNDLTNKGFETEEVIYCACCGPEGLRVRLSNGKTLYKDNWDVEFEVR